MPDIRVFNCQKGKYATSTFKHIGCKINKLKEENAV